MPLFNNPDFQRLVLNRGPKALGKADPSTTADYVPEIGHEHGNIGYYAGSHVPDYLEGHHFLKPVGNYLNALGTNTMASLLLGGVFGGLGGAGYGLLRGKPVVNSALTGAAIGGAGSAGLSALLKRYLSNSQNNQIHFTKQQNVKRSFYGMDDPDPVVTIQSKLFADQGVTGSQKTMLMNLLSSLNPSQIQQLSTLVHGGVGAGVGYLIAKFLLNLGVGGTALFSILGGITGLSSGGKYNAYGQRVNTEYDPFGQRHAVY